MSYLSPQNKTETQLHSAIGEAVAPGEPNYVAGNFSVPEWRDLMADLLHSLERGITTSPNHGPNLPSSPAVDDIFMVTNNPVQFYICRTAGEWTLLNIAPTVSTPDAAGIMVDASGFDGNLATTDDNVQKVAQKVDDLYIPTVTNDFTNSDKTKLDGIESGAQVNVSYTAGTGLSLNNNAFSVDSPFTDSYKSKIDGIETGAQVNPRHVSLPFRTQNGSSALAGDIFFIKADNTEWNSGSSNDIVAIEMNDQQYTLTQNPSVDNATYTGWHSLPEDIVINSGSTIWTFQRIANSSPFGPISGTLRIQAETIVKNSDGNFVLQNLTVLEGLSNTFGSGVNWQVVGAFAPPSGADAINRCIG